MSFVDVLNKYCDWCDKGAPHVTTVTVNVLPTTARRKLRIPKAEPIIYRGRTINCIGSIKWRRANPSLAYNVGQGARP